MYVSVYISFKTFTNKWRFGWWWQKLLLNLKWNDSHALVVSLEDHNFEGNNENFKIENLSTQFCKGKNSM
jgi:hypothetical protein